MPSQLVQLPRVESPHQSELTTKISPVPARAYLILLTCLLALAGVPGAATAQPLETGVFDHIEFPGPERDLAFDRVIAAGGTSVRISVPWGAIAPGGEDGMTKPDGFRPRDPTDPFYKFASLDAQVTAAVRHGLMPILTIFHAPLWAERGTEGNPGARDPDPEELARFTEAVARRYSGTVQDLPRVSHWMLWNEPNLHRYFMPQYDTPYGQLVQNGTKALSPGRYRRLLQAFAREVHAVHPDNEVIAGGLAPFGRAAGGRHAVAPLRFMRELLCMSTANKPEPGCKPLRFDIWSTHPYTEGGPNHSSIEPENASLGDLPEMRKILKASVRSGHVKPNRKMRFWVTEFSWDTKPPDPEGVPMKIHARWVSEALYNMWRSGVSLVTWFKIRDEPSRGADGLHHESGLYFCNADGSDCNKRKRSFTAFQFPFVAFDRGNRVQVWGRAPNSRPATVDVEQRGNKGWRPLKTMDTNRFGIFRTRIRTRGDGPLRARIPDPPRARSLPFELMETPDFFVKIFGAE